MKGKSFLRELVDYGEKAMFTPVAHGGKMNKLESRMSFGRFWGSRPKSNEAMIMAPRVSRKRARSGDCQNQAVGHKRTGEN